MRMCHLQSHLSHIEQALELFQDGNLPNLTLLTTAATSEAIASGVLEGLPAVIALAVSLAPRHTNTTEPLGIFEMLPNIFCILG